MVPENPGSPDKYQSWMEWMHPETCLLYTSLGLAACDTSSVLDALNDCVSKGIPVVTFDTGIADAPEGSIACEVCTDNAQAGSVAVSYTHLDVYKRQV